MFYIFIIIIWLYLFVRKYQSIHFKWGANYSLILYFKNKRGIHIEGSRDMLGVSRLSQLGTKFVYNSFGSQGKRRHNGLYCFYFCLRVMAF